MRYISVVILALLMMGLIVGCAQTAPTAEPVGESAATGNVVSEVGDAIDSSVIDDTDEVEIGEMI